MVPAPTLADVMPAVARSFGVDARGPGGWRSELVPRRDVVVLLVDGLGARLLEAYDAGAPTLSSARVATLAAGFPATTATSLSSLALGVPCGGHGILGYCFGIPDPAGGDGPRLFNPLRWTLDGARGADAREILAPRAVQERSSVLEVLAAAGVEVHYVAPGYQERSGLTRASFRADGTFHPASTVDEVRDGVLDVVRRSGSRRSVTYAYYADLDAAGHVDGPGSVSWLAQLAAVERLVADLLAALPESATLLVTGDHGMVRAGTAVDLDADPALTDGVSLVAGEARVRYVYARQGTRADSLAATWSEILGEHARVVTKEEALDEHWFGPTPPREGIERRIGDVLAVARGTSVLLRPEAEPDESRLVGHHGAFTDEEQLVPLLASPGALAD